MTLIARFDGPDLHPWQCHYFARDSFNHHAMLIPAVASPLARPEWWWGPENPRDHDAAYWAGQVRWSLELPAIEDAFVDGIGRAVWARRMAGHDAGPILYWCTVIGSDGNFCALARGKGFGIFVDVATVAGHVGAQAVDLEYLTTPRLDVQR